MSFEVFSIVAVSWENWFEPAGCPLPVTLWLARRATVPCPSPASGSPSSPALISLTVTSEVVKLAHAFFVNSDLAMCYTDPATGVDTPAQARTSTQGPPPPSFCRPPVRCALHWSCIEDNFIVSILYHFWPHRFSAL